MAALLASADRLRALLGRTEEELPDATAELWLELASGEARAYTGRLFDATEDETIIVDGTGHRLIELPEVPVTDVASVIEAVGTDDEVELDGPDATRPVWEWTAHGTLRRIDGGVWRARARWYEIVFSHGFTIVPDEVESVVLRVAGRALDNPTGVRQETIGRYSYTVAGESAGVGLDSVDRRTLSHLKVRRRARAGTATGS